ncbi:S49 family peptidase [Ruegeria sp. Ofav3-42]|uniref:S49 family peptidase n=1 Tax=Ruegeria sp. Ofav3-42 TaxID=2917759 RepID=UPI001EF67308|nr:S49 family peptidase [Ruegeria sp. Ofav3-42]MCG7520853.1 S49 family peptidase [Ruegeria sp. Ofav3-42]
MKPGEMVNIASRAFNTPLFLDARKATVIAQQMGQRFLGMSEGTLEVANAVEGDATALTVRRPLAASMVGDELYRSVKKRGDGYSNIMGVAVISVSGTLVRRGSYVGESSGTTSYEGLSAQIRAAAEDDEVRAIALEIDSFGGEAAGMFDLCAQIREARQSKPVHAFLAEYALSAAYGIASQADTVTIPPYGEAGSIGVVCMHVDHSEMLANQGVKVTLVHSGAHKVDGNPFEPLPEHVHKELQDSGDEMWVQFANEVAEGRKGKISAEGALKLQARVLRGDAAVKAGLADQVAEARVAFKALVASLNPVPTAAVPQAASTQAISVNMPTAGAVSEALNSPQAARAIQRQCEAALLLSSSSGCKTGAKSPIQKEVVMSGNDQTPVAMVQPETNVDAPKPGATTQTAQDAAAEERNRAAKITEKVAKAGLPASFAQELISDGVPLADAYEKILDKKAASANDGGDILNSAPARVTGDVRDRTTEGMTKAILAKANLEGGEQNEFTSMSLREMARYSLQAQGIVISSGGVMTLAAAAFSPVAASGGMHSTSDFTNILSNVAEKSMLKGFVEAPEIFDQFTSVGTLGDFKPTTRVGLDHFPSLDKVGEGAEFQYGKMGDHAETAILATYGKLFSITRQTIINDDLDAFTKIPARMGRAARRTVGDLVFAILNTNPKMSDGKALFHTGHGNLATAGGVPSEASINAGITAMANQTPRGDTKVKLNIAPKFLLAPPKHRSSTLQSLNSEHSPDDTAKAGATKQPRAFNTVRDAAEPLFDARVAGDAWFLLGDPNMHDTIEVSYLDGVDTPFLEQQEGWSVDGTEFKVRIDAAATALAEQAVYKNGG